MTKKTSTIRTDSTSTASAGVHAAVSSAETAKAAESVGEAGSSPTAPNAGNAKAAGSGGKAGAAPSLRSVFPKYRDITEIRQEIEVSPQMSATFHSWTSARQQEFLDFCCGNRGLRILYDTYFKHVFDPDARPEELSQMISALIGLDVTVIEALPNESHLGADYTLVIMDIIVETGDGSIINVEVQKIGYNFPGERAACYNADLLLRQYRRIRKEFPDYVPESSADTDAGNDGADGDTEDTDDNSDTDDNGKKKKGKGKFSYKLMRPVYTLVFMEKSTGDFRNMPEHYIHTFTPVSDTGLKLNLLQNYIFVALDIFKRHLHPLLRPDEMRPFTEREAWLAFLSSDDPRVILKLLEQFPGTFRPLYDRICMMCRNTQEMMRMFSEELAIMDKNTVMLMIEEQQETIEKQSSMLREKDESLREKDKSLREKDDLIQLLKEEIQQLRSLASPDQD